MTRTYYPIRCRLNYKDHWLIWHTNVADDNTEVDGVVVTGQNEVAAFRTQQSAIAYAEAEVLLPIETDNPAFYNLDVVKKWLRRKRPVALDCTEFLNTWNLLADLSATIYGDFDADQAKTRQIYRKLFWGNNLPAVTPDGQHYDPIWPGRESRIMRHVLREGLAMFRSSIRQV